MRGLMVFVGLTGGIASGKSTVARTWAGLGAVIIDADVLAREVVAPGTPGFDAVRQRFGEHVIGPDGSLDRPALGRIVFGDAAARRDLEQIIHPRVVDRTHELREAAAPGAVVVHDIPLLVELDRAGDYDLVVIVGASAETRLRRLVELRGMAPDAARERIAAQADDAARRAVADVWLDNEGTEADLIAAAERLWHERLRPLAS
ncbi:dephospho-CoA kinase [Microlunatus sp. Y2014]|uniref:dephospho-CoA kinase n=1 Tax=Microlunatus sp. Y2014 TaxID=3418488 RepID=UPI003DA71C8A